MFPECLIPCKVRKAMKHNIYFRSFLTLAAMFLWFMMTTMTVQANVQAESLVEKIAALELGMDGYVIGTRLSAEKKEYAATHLQDNSYPGTYKFKDGDLLVVAAQKDDTVLAIYQRQEKAGIAQVRKMISGLMGLFGEPTTMAHDKLVYWAYDEQGKIREEQYRQLREKGEKFAVLATVKLNSTLTITTEDKQTEDTGTTYFIITSDPLIQDFMRQ